MASLANRIVAKGRGATDAQASPRFGLPERSTDGDWRDTQAETDGEPALRTEVVEEHPRTILTTNQSPDVPFDRSVNAYRGCEHGCIYCFARPTHAYLDLSPGLDFETRLTAKPDAAKLLRETLAKPGYQVRPIALGTNTDPYQPIEARYRITRNILELMLEVKHPVCITTKSNRVIDDIDLIGALAKERLVAVAISVTTLDPKLARLMEPRAPHPFGRLKAVRRLAEAGVPTHVNFAPMVPAINDHELEAVAEASAAAGAVGFSSIPLRLPHEVAPLFADWLDVHFPDRKDKVLAIVRSLRGGRLNDPGFGTRMKGEGPWAELMATRRRIARRRHGFEGGKWDLATHLFRPPPRGGQLSLF